MEWTREVQSVWIEIHSFTVFYFFGINTLEWKTFEVNLLQISQSAELNRRGFAITLVLGDSIDFAIITIVNLLSW